MKLKSILGVLVLASLLGCEETPPPIDYTETEPFVTRTEVLSSLPAAQGRNALIEDLTGVRCPNCPDAAIKSKQLKLQHGSRVVPVGLYTAQPKNLTTPHTGDPNLTTDEATNLYTNIFDSPPLPGGGVNRIPADGDNSINQSYLKWATSTQKIVDQNSIINVNALLNMLNDSTFELSADFTFLQEINGNTFVSIMLLENEIEATQTADTGDIEDYVHEHVLRKMLTPYNGAILFKDAEKGRFLEAKWNIDVPKHININNSYVVIIVNRNDADNKEVLQCLEVSL